MSFHRQDLAVCLFYYFGYSRVKNLIFRLRRKPVARFIMFHDLLPNEIRQFKAKLRFLKRYTNVVSLDDFFFRRLSFRRLNTVITFDDGYKSWVSEAVPLLQELDLPAAFFISSGFIGLSKQDEETFASTKLFTKLGSRHTTGCLNCEDVRDIAERGFTIGGHTVNHCILTELNDPVELRYEIAEDKKRLEDITGKQINYFSYPSGGYYHPKIDIIDVLKKCGYMGAVTTISGLNHTLSNPYLLHRELTNASMSGQVFRARAYGNYEPVKMCRRQLHTFFTGRRIQCLT